MTWDDADALLGARDVLVFRRVGRRWTHLGGTGRGTSWVGSVELSAQADPRLETALTLGRPVRRHGQRPHRVIGPYWAATSAVVRVDDSHAVVLGSSDPTPRLLHAPDPELLRVATAAVEGVTSGLPAKHLADELEVLTVLRDLAVSAPLTVDELLLHLCAVAAEALRCDLAAVWLDDERHAAVELGWRPRGGPQRAVIAARQLAGGLGVDPAEPEWLVVDDASSQPLPEPIGADEEVASYLALPLSVDGERGCLLLVHSVHPHDRRRSGTATVTGASPDAGPAAGPGGATPNRFSPTAQSLGLQLARAGSRLLEAASTHDELIRQLDSTREHALMDPLTGAANRRGWDEAVARARDHVASGGTVTVVSVDLDDLKVVNDTHGHAAGDELIIGCARALRRCVRGTADVIARLGGDEFALLMRGHEVEAEEIVGRLRGALERTFTAQGVPLRTSMGASTCPPRGSLDEAVRVADVEMYRDKRARRRAE